MKLALLLILGLGLGCSKTDSSMPTSLQGKTLRGTVTSASGVFAGIEGYQFTTIFNSNSQFETKNAQGAIESSGQYNIKKNRLILQSNSGLHPNESLEVILKFTDSKSGTYEAHPMSDTGSEQTGIFSLQYL